MNTQREQRAADIFKAALEYSGPPERAAFLDGVCAGDPELRAAVEALLATDASAADFLARDVDSPSRSDPDATTLRNVSLAPQPPSEKPGKLIGRYKLLEQIGEGGFGAVWMAEQREPVKRRVALKVIKLGMDTRQVIARFEAERQALAMMDHPNIARVLDAGATDAGRPFFVMELVRGVPITEFCDQERLDTQRRLELFAQVCNAVQHAHTKGIIHRDIKPSNVLVTLHDGVPVPKVIDFGIAKATSAELTEKTLFTEHRQMIGTPAYMSPEQAEMSGLDVDTRSDVYSLGVLLYELLTGTPPFDPKKLLSAGHAEMVRIIREEEPPKPSLRLSSLGERLTSVSRSRQIDPRRLCTLLRGELDVVVMKCLEKDRSRRYETASGLGADVRRYLSGEPIEARRGSAWYVLWKLFQRYRGPVAITAAAFLLLAGFSVVMSVLYERALRAETSAKDALLEANQNRSELERALEETNRARRAEALAQFDLDLEREKGEQERAESILANAKQSQRFDDLPVRDVVDAIADSIPLNVVVQWQALAPHGIRPEKRVSLNVENLSIASILQELCSAADDRRRMVTYELSGRTILIGTAESTKKRIRFRAPGISAHEVLSDDVLDRDYIRAALHKRVAEVQFTDLPAKQMADWLSEYTGLRVELDASVAPVDRPITISAKNLRLSQVLWMTGSEWCGSADDEVAWLLDSQRILLSTRRALCARLQAAPLYPEIESSESARLAAMDLAHRFMNDHERLIKEAWKLVRSADGDLAVYRPALRLVQAAQVLMQEDGGGAYDVQANLGAALYRVGCYKEGLQALLRAVAAQRRTGARADSGDAAEAGRQLSDLSEPIYLAFGAMALHRLGQRAEAAAALGQVRELMEKQPTWKTDEDCGLLLREAEQLIEGKTSPPSGAQRGADPARSSDPPGEPPEGDARDGGRP